MERETYNPEGTAVINRLTREISALRKSKGDDTAAILETLKMRYQQQGRTLTEYYFNQAAKRCGLRGL